MQDTDIAACLIRLIDKQKIKSNLCLPIKTLIPQQSQHGFGIANFYPVF